MSKWNTIERGVKTMGKDKQMALETLEKVKEIYDNEGGDLLCGGFWCDFMAVVNSQIAEISQNTQ